jgi:hypothetical protein
MTFSSAEENGFVDASGDDIIWPPAHASGPAGGDSVMLEAVLLLLGLASCALVVVAFWGSNLLGSEWRRQR